MFSYHRVLKLFGRSVADKTIECDCDIHPWEIEIDGQQWPGKIRLIGFVDVFFVISYSANMRFEKGVIIYKDPMVFEELTEDLKQNRDAELPESNTNNPLDSYDEDDVESIKQAEQKPREKEETMPKQSPEDMDLDDSDTEEQQPTFNHKGRYMVRSLGHEIGLTNVYPLKSVRKYEIKISKPHNWALRRRIKRGIRPHSIPQLMEDVVRCGFLTQAELIAQILGLVSAGGTFNDTTRRYFAKLSAGNAGQQTLSNDRI